MIASLDKHPVSGEPPSLFAILAARARTASDATLAACAAIGGVAAVALIAARPRWWMYALRALRPSHRGDAVARGCDRGGGRHRDGVRGAGSLPRNDHQLTASPSGA